MKDAKWHALPSVLLLLAVVLPCAGLQTSQNLQSYGKVIYSPSFVYQGTNVGRPHFLVGCENYVPNAFEIIADLGINTILVYGGPEGGTMWNIELTSTWAENLDSFLAMCDSHGVKVIFQQLGTPYNHMFGIHAGEDIDLSKNKVDKLAGNNSLGKNFLTDPRIAFWICVNEPDLGDPVLLAWCQEMGDYFKQKGAKVAACGGAIGLPGNEMLWVHLVRDHSTHLVIHHYHLQSCQDAQDQGKNIFDTMYPLFKANIDETLSVRGNIPLENIIFGEFGLFHGTFTFEGYTYNFTEETRGEYYRAAFETCKDAGIGGVFPFYLFDTLILAAEEVEPFGAIALDGTYYTEVTDQYKAHYLASNS